jgi:phosphoglycerate dehydrogenase-like enzyme
MPPTVPHNPAAIIALTEREYRMFFPMPLRERLLSLLPQAHLVEPLTMNGEWEATLRREQPELIVSGWHTAPIPADLTRLRCVCHVQGSVRRHVPRVLLERGVRVYNWGDAIAETVGEATLAMILAALRRTQHFGRLLHEERGWQWAPGGALSLYDRRVGIHGFGAVARSLIALLAPFRTPIRVFTHGDLPSSQYKTHGVERAASMDDLFDWAEVIVEAEAYTPKRHHVINEELLRRLRPQAVFVNIARGALVDEAALARVASEGSLRVALDVFEHEPLSDHSPLRGLRDATLLPHLAGPTDDRTHLCGERTLRILECFLQGETPVGPLTLETYDRAT